MSEADWHIEKRVGIKIGRDGISLFSSKTGFGRPQQALPAPEPRRSWAMWTLPLIATAGVATAVPTVQAPRVSPGEVWMPLDAAAPTPHLAPIEPMTRTEPARPGQRILPLAPRRSHVDVPKSFFEETATQETDQEDGPEAAPQAGLSQRAALASAFSTGQATDWVDGKTGQGGLVVVGDPDERGCRDVVVMTRRADGRNDNAARRECSAAR